MPKLSIQYAHQENTADELGEVGSDDAVSTFQNFPWREQREEASRLQLCSPSIFLKDDNDNLFFVSILDGVPDSDFDFMLFLETDEEVEIRRWFKKQKGIRRNIYDSCEHNEANVEAAIKAFCKSDIEEVKKIIAIGN